MSTSVVLPTSPALLATVTNAVQQVASLPACSLPASVADPAGIPVPLSTLSQLAAQASSFAASGAGYASSLPATATPTASGRPNNCLVPTFVSTFSTLFRRLLTQPFHAALPSSTIGTASLAPLPGLHELFVVGPGFSPVPAKLVNQIAAGKFVELHALLPLNIFLRACPSVAVRWAPCINVPTEEA